MGKLASMVVVALLAAPAPARAQDASEPELDALLEVLEEETEIATKTRMNSDFVPGIVTVLDGDKLEALGARTVWDALPFVPGVQATLDGVGAPGVTVRGIPFPFNSGSIQILVNSIPMGREAAGLNGSALYLPIEQVERIEFVRGPGSVLYGDAAFMGLLNVITRRDGPRADLAADSHRQRNGSLLLSTGADEPLALSLNVALLQSDDAVTPVGTKAEENRFSGVFSLERGGFRLTTQAVGRDMRDVDAAPQNISRDETSLAVEARYDRALGESLDLRVRAQYLDSDLDTPTNDFQGEQVKFGAELFGRAFERHEWLAGIEYVDGDIHRAVGALPPLPPGTPPFPRVPPTVRDRSRETTSFYAQDQIELTGRLSTTLGARYDHTSDQGGRVTPRAALVFRLADRHVLKAQYSEGFRSPTFFEQYLAGGPVPPELDFEVNRTTEVNYVYQRPQLTARATVFRTEIDDMVFRDFARQTFDNVASADARGVELEVSQQLGSAWRIDANVSYVDSEDNRNPPLETREVESGPRLMANLGLLWNPTADWIVGAHWNHIGSRDAATRGDGSHDLVDLAVTKKNLFVDRLDVRVGVDNVFDRRTVELFPAAVAVIEFPYKDRAAWARLTWRW